MFYIKHDVSLFLIFLRFLHLIQFFFHFVVIENILIIFYHSFHICWEKIK